jgi:hypothetical protein
VGKRENQRDSGCVLALLIMALSLVLISCTSQNKPTLVASSLPPSATPTSIPSIVLTKPLITISPTLATSSTATIVASPTSTSTPTKAPTLTPLPRLSPREAEALVLELFENNRGCQLPCWWGFTPGQTEWATAEQLLATFALDIEYIGSPVRPPYFAYVFFAVPEEFFSTGRLQHLYTIGENGIIEGIEVEMGEALNYRLPTFLSLYGEPSEIWVFTNSRPRQGSLGFNTVLFYPFQGIMIRYSSDGEVEGVNIRGCPQDDLSPRLMLWPAESNYTYAGMTNRTLGFGFEGYRLLEEATELDTGAFHELFRNADNVPCLISSANLWPEP